MWAEEDVGRATVVTVRVDEVEEVDREPIPHQLIAKLHPSLIRVGTIFMYWSRQLQCTEVEEVDPAV